jgi:hypothetical protein
MKWFIAYVVCPLIGGAVIYWKQGRYLTEEQPLAFILFGPFMLLICLLPKSFFAESTSANVLKNKGESMNERISK